MEWFSSVIAAAVSILTDPYAPLFCVLGISFLLLSSVLNVRTLLRGAASDFGPVMIYFASVFGLLFLLPLAVIFLLGRAAGVTPWSMGLGLGNWRLGLILSVVFLPLSLLGLFIGLRDPVLREHYPFSKEAMSSPGRFVLYELAYLVLYYLPWEFTFRGVVIFSLLALLPHTVPALVVVVMVSTFLSTIFHIGHPSSEVLGAFILGVLAGAATAVTGSFLYVLFQHALVGILNDCIAYQGRVRLQQKQRSESFR
jgi:Type II CAAX prenyl endopeptidase Rce1-like